MTRRAIHCIEHMLGKLLSFLAQLLNDLRELLTLLFRKFSACKSKILNGEFETAAACSSTCVVFLFGFNSPCREGTHYTYCESLNLASCNVTVLSAI